MRVLFLITSLLSFALTVAADEYIDPQSNVVYTYEPGQATASVKAGYREMVYYHSGNPDAAGDVVILDRFTMGTTEYIVTSIGAGAFYTNKNIKSVIIPETVTEIGLEAFANCDSLGNLTLPASLTFVGRDAFSNTPWYAALFDEAPDGPFYIGSILLGCKGEKPTGDLVVREGTTCIGYNALHDCKGLTSVTIPASVAYVDEMAFTGCTHLAAVYITDLAAWCGIKFQYEVQSSSNPLCIAHHLYLNGEELTDLVIPTGVTSIGSYAFDNCTSLKRVTIPDGVCSVGRHAFRSCDSLASVTIPPSLTTIGYYAFLWCHHLDAVHISDLAVWCGISFRDNVNPLAYAHHLYLDGKEVKDLVIPDEVTSIGDGTFQGCMHLASVTIPDGVTSIGESAFEGCSGLTDIHFPASLSSIGNSAFSNCSGLTSIVIPESVVCIGEGTFNGCNGVASVTIPANVSTIGRSAFRNCRELTCVTSRIEEPFKIEDDVFKLYDSELDEWYFSSATLYVPKGCKSRYEATAGWSRFSNIIEMDSEGVDNVLIADSQNRNTDTPAAIYDLHGRRMQGNPAKGVYIRDGRKVVVK